jgi:hypothetical protein
LTWLRQLALQSRVDIATGSRELVEGLESGDLSWIACSSSSVLHVERTMGHAANSSSSKLSYAIADPLRVDAVDADLRLASWRNTITERGGRQRSREFS